MWLPLDLNEISTCLGVDGFLSEEGWLHIGKALSLAKRFLEKYPTTWRFGESLPWLPDTSTSKP